MGTRSAPSWAGTSRATILAISSVAGVQKSEGAGRQGHYHRHPGYPGHQEPGGYFPEDQTRYRRRPGSGHGQAHHRQRLGGYGLCARSTPTALSSTRRLADAVSSGQGERRLPAWIPMISLRRQKLYATNGPACTQLSPPPQWCTISTASIPTAPLCACAALTGNFDRRGRQRSQSSHLPTQARRFYDP